MTDYPTREYIIRETTYPDATKQEAIGELVRCKDCKHRPTGTNRDDLEFPDDKCPCQCEDFWYSWKPSDDWFCGNGERKDGLERTKTDKRTVTMQIRTHG